MNLLANFTSTLVAVFLGVLLGLTVFAYRSDIWLPWIGEYLSEQLDRAVENYFR